MITALYYMTLFITTGAGSSLQRTKELCAGVRSKQSILNVHYVGLNHLNVPSLPLLFQANMRTFDE